MAAMRLLAGIIFSAALLGSDFAQAQIIQLGGSDSETKARLMAQGYDRVDIVDRGLSSTTYRACRGAERVQFKVYWDGRIGNPRVIGGCRVVLSIAQIEALLADRGFRRVSLEDRGSYYIAVGCRQGQRVRVQVSPQGDLERERVIGQCGQALAPADVAALLERQGYDRVQFTDRQLPRYAALACFNNRRFELTLNRRGEIVDRRRAGNCEAPINPYELPQILAQRGYERVQIIDDRLPRYMVEACRNNRRMQVTLNRFGAIIDEIRIGRCRQALNADQLADSLKAQGFKRVRITDNGNAGYSAIACLDDKRSELVITRFGEITRQIDLGGCTSRSVQQVINDLESAGLDRISIVAEACRKKRRLRVELNEYGEEVSRQRIGNC